MSRRSDRLPGSSSYPLLFALVVACNSGRVSPDGVATFVGTDAGAAAAVAFPLRVSDDRKTLVDRNGAPFFLQGDTAWEIVQNLSQADVVAYLDDRQRRGFSAILVNAIEHKLTPHKPPWLDSRGNSPFVGTLGGGVCAAAGAALCDYSTPNDAYFESVDFLVREAERRGIVVLLAPSYLGYGCADEGWCVEMRANGTARLTQYGQYLGRRYKTFPNIVWVEGGDHTPSTTGSPSELDLVDAVASGIIAGEGGGEGVHLHTAHWSGETAAADIPGLSWLSIDTTYSYRATSIYAATQAHYARDAGRRPAFLIEAMYENEHDTTRTELRAQMIEPVLSGEMGFVFGNAPLWFFGSAGDGNPGWSYPDSPARFASWRTALSSPASQDAARVGTFFRSIAWYTLRPDGYATTPVAQATEAVSRFVHRIMRLAGSTSRDPAVRGAVQAISADASLVVDYLPTKTTVKVDLSRLAGAGPVTAQWFDPATGALTSVTGSPLARTGTHEFTSPGARPDGSEDWVLILRTK